MDPLGHMAITLSSATAIAGIGSSMKTSAEGRKRGRLEKSELASVSGQNKLFNLPKILWGWLSFLGQYVDIRILLIGSLLPDLIDKPLGEWLFKSTIDNGRIFAHTLLFFILLALSWFLVYRLFKKNGLLVLSFGTFIHLILDSMWENPKTLFWPFFGFTFAPEGEPHWLQDIINDLLRNPAVYYPEILGLLILLLLVWALWRNGKLYSFIRYGKI